MDLVRLSGSGINPLEFEPLKRMGILRVVMPIGSAIFLVGVEP